MNGIGTNFLAGLLLGLALAVLAPLAAVDLAAGGVEQTVATTSTKFEIQTVNRTTKGDRLNNPIRAKQDADSAAPTKIPIGCDAAFSPLTRGTNNFASRCLA